jgi:hypothetical protein
MAEVREMQEHFPAKSVPLYHIPAGSGNAWIRLISTAAGATMGAWTVPMDNFVQACFP